MSTALSVTQPAPSFTEHELVVAVRRGSNEAFEELFSRYRGQIGAYVLGMIGDHGRAEDIAQEVFISALRRLRETERPIAFRPWIYEIAKNACIDEFRRVRRLQEVPLDIDRETESQAHTLAAHTPSADATVESKQRFDHLRGAFRGLSPNHHRVLVMRELEGLSYDQIGARLGMSTPVVESTLFRARRRLGQEYDDLVSGRRCAQVQTVIDAGGERPLRRLGIRQRKLLARHLAHCQPCRRHARLSGVDESFFQPPSLIGKIAAVLPLPWLRWRTGRGEEDTLAGTGSHPVAVLQSVQSAAQYVDVGGASIGLGRAAATVAAIVIAGAGGGFATGLGAHGDSLPQARAALHRSAVARTRTATGSRAAGPVSSTPLGGAGAAIIGPLAGAGAVPNTGRRLPAGGWLSGPAATAGQPGHGTSSGSPSAGASSKSGGLPVVGNLPGGLTGGGNTGGGNLPLGKLPTVHLPSLNGLLGAKPAQPSSGLAGQLPRPSGKGPLPSAAGGAAPPAALRGVVKLLSSVGSAAR